MAGRRSDCDGGYRTYGKEEVVAEKIEEKEGIHDEQHDDSD